MGNPITSIVKELIRTEGLSHVSQRENEEFYIEYGISIPEDVEILQLYKITQKYKLLWSMHYYCNKISPFILNNNNVISRDRLRRAMKYRWYDYQWYVIKNKNFNIYILIVEIFFLPMHPQSYFYLSFYNDFFAL